MTEYLPPSTDRASPQPVDSPQQISRTLSDKELPWVQRRRIRRYLSIDLTDREFEELAGETGGTGSKSVVDRNLVGLALSGGGIRSASFGLGVLQGLADCGVLRLLDYLSTVSGGGYIGAWYAAWVLREGDPANVEEQLRGSRADHVTARRGVAHDLRGIREAEPEPIAHLREFSNYLAPRASLMSGDTWSLIATVFRNLLANQLVLFPLLAAVVLFCRLIGAVYLLPSGSVTVSIFSSAGLVFFFLALSVLAWIQRKEENTARHRSTGKLMSALVLALSISAVALPLALQQLDWLLERLVTLAPGVAAPENRAWVTALTAGVLVAVPAVLSGSPLRILCSFCAGGFTGWLLATGLAHSPLSRTITLSVPEPTLAELLTLAQEIREWNPRLLLATAGPGLILLLLFVLNAVEVALLSREIEDSEREWSSRYGARLLLVAGAWALTMFLSLFGGQILKTVFESLTWWISLPLTGIWAGIAIAGLQVARSAQASGRERRTGRDIVSTLAPHLFLAGALCALSWLIGHLVDSTSALNGMPDGLRNLLAMLMAAAATLVMAWRVDINEFSLNAMYSNRLIRCFLGASRVKERDAWLGVPTGVKGKPRSPHPATGFDGDDDLPLSAFVPGRNLVNDTCVQGQVVHYWGPTLIMNSAMNLVAGEQLAWQERKAESFSLGAAWCGAASVGYRATSHYATNRAPWFLSTTEPPKPLTLGRSMAISGAAANPNMGYHSSPSAAAFMTIFNVRLGWWLPNPRDQQKCRTPGPRFGLLYLIRELLGYTRSDAGYVNVSDGGHFDNLGIYELVRRRTRYIIASDAGADPDLEFRDLADVIRKCETDFGIRIEIELSGLRKADNGRSPARCAIGIIRYDRVDPAAPVGVLVYMKPVLTGAESTPILEYAARSPRFPHESTLDQFFSESQFESYRALGWTTVSEVFKEAARVAERAEVDADDELRKTRAANPGLSAGECRTASDRWHNNLTANLFHQLRKDWQPRYLALDDRFVQATQEYSQFHAAAGAAAKRTGDNSLTTHLYPELSLRDSTGLTHPAPARVHSAAQLVQIMENAWFTMNLSEYQHHPLNAGWMNALRRLAGSAVVREFWPVLRHEFSREFVRFAERRLDLRVTIGPPQRLRKRAQLQPLKEVVREFEQDQLADEFQWNSPPASDENPRPLLSSVCRTARINGRNLIWTIRLRLEVESSGVTHAGVQNPVAGLALIRPVQIWRHGSPPVPAFVKDLRCFELVVWIRPAYRQQGIGTKLVETLLYGTDSSQFGEEFLKSVLGDNFYLVVTHSRFRHPRDRSFWKSFFSFYDFRGLSDPAADCRSWPETGDRELLCLKYPVQ